MITSTQATAPAAWQQSLPPFLSYSFTAPAFTLHYNIGCSPSLSLPYKPFPLASILLESTGEIPSRPPTPPQGLAAFLSAEDLSNVAAALRVFVLQVLLPGLQARILRLDANVTATRRGLRNRLTRFWKAPAVAGVEDVLNDK